MLLSAVVFNVPNLLSYAGINLAYRLSFVLIYFFFYFASFSSHFLLIYINQTKISLKYTGKKSISTGLINLFKKNAKLNKDISLQSTQENIQKIITIGITF